MADAAALRRIWDSAGGELPSKSGRISAGDATASTPNAICTFARIPSLCVHGFFSLGSPRGTIVGIGAVSSGIALILASAPAREAARTSLELFAHSADAALPLASTRGHKLARGDEKDLSEHLDNIASGRLRLSIPR